MTAVRTNSTRRALAAPLAGRVRVSATRIRPSTRPASGAAKSESPGVLTTFENPIAVLFAQHVAVTIDAPLLRWSIRQRLLADAARLGLPRFEANLIIAIVQRQRESAPQAEPRASTLAHLAPWAMFAAVQGAIIFAAWRLLSL